MKENFSKKTVRTWKGIVVILIVFIFCAGAIIVKNLQIQKMKIPSFNPLDADFVTGTWENYTDYGLGYFLKYPQSFKKEKGKDILTLEDIENNLYFIVNVLKNPKDYGVKEFYEFYSNPENAKEKESQVGKEVINRYDGSRSAEFITAVNIEGVKFIANNASLVVFSHGRKIYELVMPSENLISPANQNILSFMIATFRFID